MKKDESTRLDIGVVIGILMGAITVFVAPLKIIVAIALFSVVLTVISFAACQLLSGSNRSVTAGIIGFGSLFYLTALSMVSILKFWMLANP